MAENFSLVLSAKFDGIHEHYLYFDTIKEKSLSAKSHIAVHPLQDGNTMADHMYRLPDEYTVSGTFSLNGSANYFPYDTSYKINGISSNKNRLTNIQEVFEYIKDKGILCDLMTIDRDTDDIQFKIRRNMALESIQWTEYLNNMNYSLSFKEILMVQVQQYETEPYVDPYLPSCYMPSSKSVGEELIGTDEDYNKNLRETIIKNLIETGFLLEEECAIIVANKNKYALGAIITTILSISGVYAAMSLSILAIAGSAALVAKGAAVGATTGAVIAGKVGGAALSALVPVGTIVIVGIAIIAAAYFITKAIKKRVQYKRKIENAKFIINLSQYLDKKGNIKDNYVDAQLNITNINKLEKLINAVKNSLKELGSKGLIYSLMNNKNELVINEDSEFAIEINGGYYYFSFVRNNLYQLIYKFEEKDTDILNFFNYYKNPRSVYYLDIKEIIDGWINKKVKEGYAMADLYPLLLINQTIIYSLATQDKATFAINNIKYQIDLIKDLYAYIAEETNKEISLRDFSRPFKYGFQQQKIKISDDCNPWLVKVKGPDEKTLSSFSNYASTVNSDSPIVTSFYNVDRYGKTLFITADENYEVYLLNPSLDEENYDNIANPEYGTLGYYNVKSQLAGYSILVVHGKLEDMMQQISDSIDSLLSEEDFTS